MALPDFERIKATVKTALEYGATEELRAAAYARLDNIDYLILVYKADVAASRGSIDDLNAAIDFLEDADKILQHSDADGYGCAVHGNGHKRSFSSC